VPTDLSGRAALNELRWQDEILQAMYWMQGEGIATAVGSAQLAGFLVGSPRVVARQMGRLAAGGYLERVPGRPRRYRLTEIGRLEGGRGFQDEFADLVRRGHGACAPGCWCHDPDHAGEPCPSHRPPSGEPKPEPGERDAA
jgi:hypothetical protein